MDDNKHENVLLLAMSTLPYNICMNTYKAEYGEKSWYFKSITQMEPHTKYLIKLLEVSDEKLDRIVILASEKARNEKPSQWNNETAVSLYKKRIKNFLGKDVCLNIPVKDVLEDLSETVPCKSLYNTSPPEIKLVELEKEVYFWDAVQKIRGEISENPVHLYMDMQGGDRNTIAQMNAIVQMLEDRNVHICGRFANDYEPKKEKPLHHIREASREYRSYELTTAMSIFKNYGWGEKLRNYFQDLNNGSRESYLLRAINQASNAISKCNADNFDKAVGKIDKLQEQFENPDSITELDVVYQDIKEDYQPLFNARYHYAEQIRWCLKKQFLQQALTIFETKMPYEFITSGMVYYFCDGENRNQLLEAFSNIYMQMNKSLRFQMVDLNHYVLKRYMNVKKNENGYQYSDSVNIIRFGADENKTLALIHKYLDICKLRNQVSHAAVGIHNEDGFFTYMKNKYPSDRNWINTSGTNYEQQLIAFLDKWEALADTVPDNIRRKVRELS